MVRCSPSLPFLNGKSELMPDLAVKADCKLLIIDEGCFSQEQT